MLVHEAMTRPVVMVGPEYSVHYTAELLVTHRIASAPVVDDAGNLVGVVSEADLMRGRMAPDRGPQPHAAVDPFPQLPSRVEQVMTSPALTVDPDENVGAAARLLLDRGIKMLPVLRSGRVVGVIARRDLVGACFRDDADVERDVVVRTAQGVALRQ